VAEAGLPAQPCRTTTLPLLGAAAGATRDLPTSLVARYGALAAEVVSSATVSDPLGAVAPGIDVTRAEIEYAVTHEGALDASDVLDRRTRIGLVPADAERTRAAVEEIVAAALA
jgi:glycerol-3-phosphate dehydrogenase